MTKLTLERCGRWTDDDLQALKPFVHHLTEFHLMGNSGFISTAAWSSFLEAAHILKLITYVQPLQLDAHGRMQQFPTFSDEQLLSLRSEFPQLLSFQQHHTEE
jgi:hypothetical protein